MKEDDSLLISTENQVAYLNFINAIKSPATKKKYSYLLFEYLKYLQLNNTGSDLLLEDLLSKNVRTIENDIIKYIIDLKEKKGLSYSSLNNKLAAIYLFYTMNDVIINRKKLGKYLGEHIKTIKDRGYTIEEIKKIVDACSLKHKIVVTMMCSSGCRIGAIPLLTLNSLSKYHSNEKLYQITFYENTKEEYYSFVSVECSNYILEYLRFRERCGERLSNKSPLIRDDFIVDDLLHIENPKFLSLDTYHKYLKYILVKVGIRTITPSTPSSKRKRKEISQNHGFRKFAMTTMANKRINPEIREMLLNHAIGLGNSYYRPTVEEMLNEYLKVVDNLTINDENRLSKQVEELKEKNQDKDYVIKGKLKEKEEQIKNLEESVKFLSDRFNAFLIGQPENKIVYHTDEEDGKNNNGIVKGIELKPEINNKAVGKVMSSKKK